MKKILSELVFPAGDPVSLEQLQAELARTLSRVTLKFTALPLVPECKLALVDPVSLEGPLSHEEAQAVVAAPAYWSFCWASGQVLARYILDHPELVNGKRVLEIGPGSGIVAIASALAGAREVIAADIDPAALLAVQVNAAANHVEIHTQPAADFSVSPDLIIAADILYDRDNLGLLAAMRDAAPSVLLADSRVRNFDEPGFRRIAQQESRTFPDLNEFEEFNLVSIYLAEHTNCSGDDICLAAN